MEDKDEGNPLAAALQVLSSLEAYEASASGVPSSNILSVKPTSQTLNQNSCTEADKAYCRSPADLIDIFSDIVDDLAGLSGFSTLVAPLTDADPHTECIKGSIFDFLKNDYEEFFIETNNTCDLHCGPDEECEKVGAGEPEVESPRPSIHFQSPPVELALPALYVPAGFSAKSIPAPPKKKKPKKPNIIAEMPPQEPKKGCCSGCTII